MYECVIERPKLRIYFSDSSPRSDAKSTKKLRSYLETAAISLELWLKKKSQSGIALPSCTKTLECQVQICGAAKIRRLNSEYRGKDKKTDVLTFQMIEGLRGGNCEMMIPVLNLGDLFICREVARAQASQFGISLEEEVTHLFVHGWLHLCGFDHEVSLFEEQLMESHEMKILNKIALLRRKSK